MRGSVDTNFLFTLGEVTRMVRAWADREAARYGITRAQWAVLAKVERIEGMKQSELAEQLEMQPITLTRLIDKLCDNGWIERRGDEKDRRVNRLYLKKAARPLLGKLAGLRSELTATALEGINPADAHRMLAQLETILTLTRDLGVNLAGVEIILNMRRKMERMQSEVNEFMDYVKHELARGLGDWEQRLGTALVKSSPTDLVRLSSPPADVKPSTTKRPK